MDFPVAIVTGAGGGIGRATVVELCRIGYRVVLCGRTFGTLQKSSEGLANTLVVVADVTKPADVQHLVDQTMATFSRIDLIVNNAGIARMLSIEQMSIDQFHATLDTNLSAAFYLSKAVWPIFKNQNGGAIVNVSSLAARDPFPGFAAYGAAKAGLNLLGLSLAREGASVGIRVYTVAPGAVETPLLRSLFSAEQLPVAAALSPQAVAKVIASYAAGDLKYTSGEVIWLHQ